MITLPRLVRVAFGALVLTAASSIAGAQTFPPRIPLDPMEPREVREIMGFGHAVSMYGNRALVGAPWTNESGAVYVFVKDKSLQWVLKQKLVAPREPSGFFGVDVIVQDSDSALIRDSRSQRVYYFDGQSSMGSYQPRLVLRGGPARDFGNAMALEGCVALISSSVSNDAPLPGLVHVFNRCATGEWVWKGSFGAPDAQNGDRFGESISMVGKDLLVGAPGMNDNTGAAYYFSYRDYAWRFNQKLTQTGGGPRQLFGTSVSFRNGYAAIGAPDVFRDPRTQGEVELYKRDANRMWVSLGTLVEPPEATNKVSRFGSRVKITDDRLFVTSLPGGDARSPSSINIFRRVGDSLQFEKEIVSDALWGELSMDVSQGNLITGESGRPLDDPPFTQQAGAADVYVLPP